MTDVEKGEPVVVYRFADPTATDQLEVPGCHCPLGIHSSESITYRTELGGGEWESIRAAGLAASDGDYIDFGVSNSVAIAKSVVFWTLATKDACTHAGKPHGKHEPVPVNRRSASLIDEVLRQAILERIQAAAAAFAGETVDEPEAAEEPVARPNGSGARSRASSRASASPTPMTPPPA
jgi:hypothetical protein